MVCPRETKGASPPSVTEVYFQGVSTAELLLWHADTQANQTHHELLKKEFSILIATTVTQPSKTHLSASSILR